MFSILLAGAIGAIQAPSSPPLRLVAVASLEIPDSFEVVAADGNTASQLVVWGRTARDVAVRVGDRLVRVPLGADSVPVLGATVRSSGIFEVALRDRLVRFDEDGVLQTVPLNLADSVASARYHAGKWYFVSRSDEVATLGAVSWEEPAGLDFARLVMDQPEDAALLVMTPTRQRWSTLVRVADVAGDSLLVGQIGAPYRLAIVAADGSHLVPESEGWPIPPDGAWIASGGLLLGTTVLQQLVDLRSDRRVLIARDRADLTITRTHSLEGPWTLVGRTRELEPHVLAVRVLGHPELVLYRFDVK